MSKTLTAGLAGVAVAAVASGLAFAPAAHADDAVNSAYAISASGLLDVAKTPEVDSKKGFNKQSLAEIPGKTPDHVQLAKVLNVEALNAEASETGAKASIVNAKLDLGVLEGLNLDILGGEKSPLLTASVIKASCKNGVGEASVAKAKLAGKPLDVAAPANTVIEVPGVAKVTLNKQVKNNDGTLTVTAIAIDVLNGTQKLNLASATCGKGDDNKTETTTTKPADNGKKTAPKPVPVAAHLDVTG